VCPHRNLNNTKSFIAKSGTPSYGAFPNIFYRIQTVKISVFGVLHLKRNDIPQKM